MAQVEVKDKIAQSIVTKLESIERSSAQAALNLQRLDATLKTVASSGRAAGAGMQHYSRSTKAAAAQSKLMVASGTDGITRLGGAVDQLKRTGQSLRAVFSGVLLAGAVAPVLASADSYANFANRLKQATEEGDQFLEVQRQLIAIARQTGAPLATLGKGFQRIDNALKNLGGGQQESIRIVDTLVKAFAVGGLTTTETDSALTQLTQSFNSGVLAGEEFKALSEALPSIMNEIANTLGISRSALRSYREEGKITVDVLRQAFANLADDVDLKFAALDDTVGRSLERLKTAFILGFEEFDAGAGFSSSIISLLRLLTNNIPVVITLLKSLGVVLGVVFGIGALKGLTAFLAALGTGPGAILALTAAITAFKDDVTVSFDEAEGKATTFGDVIQGIVRNASRLKNFNFDVITGEGTNEQTRSSISSFFDDTKQYLTELPEGIVKSLADKTNRILAFWKAGADAISQGQGKDYFINRKAEIESYLGEIETAMADAIRPNDILLKDIQTERDLRIAASDAVFQKEKENLDALRAAREKTVEEQKKDTIKENDDLYKRLSSSGGVVSAVLNPYTGSNFTDKFRKDEIKKAIEAEQKYQKEIDRAKELTREAAAEFEQQQFQDLFPIDSITNFKTELQTLPETMREAFDQMEEIAQGRDLLGFNQPDLTNADGEGFNLPIEGLQEAYDLYVSLQQIHESFQLADQNDDSQLLESTQQRLETVKKEFGLIKEENTDTAKAISTEIPQATGSAQSAIISFTASAVANLARITAEARQAAAAVASIGSGGSGSSGGGSGINGGANVHGGADGGESFNQAFGRFGTNSPQQFMTGGYTGNGPVNRIAGVVHGQEYVMPADVTQRYRPVLEAMREGKRITNTNTNMNVSVQNYGGTRVETNQLSPTEVEVIVHKVAPQAIAKQFADPNSRVSKSLNRNTLTRRKR